MKFQISTFNTVTGQKNVRFLCDEDWVWRRQRQVNDEVFGKANEIVLTEVVNQ